MPQVFRLCPKSLYFAPERHGFAFKRLAFALKKRASAPKHVFHLVGGQHVSLGGQHVWSFEGGVMRSSSLMVAGCWVHLLGQFGKIEKGGDLGTSRLTFWPGDVFGAVLGSRKKR